MTNTLKHERHSTSSNFSVVSSSDNGNEENSDNISYMGMHKELFPKVEDRLTRGQLQEKVELLVADYIEDNSDLNLVMEIAVTYEMLGKLSSAYYYYFWAYEIADHDETLAAKLEILREKLPDMKD